MVGCAPCLGAYPESLPLPVDEGFQGACAVPTLRGLALGAAVGAIGARPGKKMAGALDGTWGLFLGCALSRALGIKSDALSVALTVGGAYFAARVFDGKRSR